MLISFALFVQRRTETTSRCCR